MATLVIETADGGWMPTRQIARTAAIHMTPRGRNPLGRKKIVENTLPYRKR